MNPEAERLIDLATRPLENNSELHLAAESELRKSLETHATECPEAIVKAADSLTLADTRPKRGRWKIALLVISALVALPLLAHTVFQLKEFAKVRSLVSMPSDEDSLEPSFPGLTARQHLLLFGKSEMVSESDKWKPLWDSEPNNPAYLAQYALAWHRDERPSSPEILSASERLDPDNAWFPALAAASLAEGAVSKKSMPYSKGGPIKTPIWIIHDQKRLSDALSAIHQLAEKSKFTDYQNELLRQRIPLLPPRRDFISQFPSMIYLQSLPVANISHRKLADVMAAGAQQCAANGDATGLRRIIADWQALVPLVGKNGALLIDVLIAKSFFNSPAVNFRDAARTLGMEREALHFAGIQDRWQQEKDAREASRKAGDENIASLRGSVFAGLTIPMLARQVNSPPDLKEEDVRPGRYADHALCGRICSWLGIVLLGLVAAMGASYRFRQIPLVRALSTRIEDLMRPSDWAWILLGGIVFPIVWYFAISGLTPLSAREWSGRMTVFIQPSCQYGSMVASMIILPALIASHRLAKRGAMLGMTGRFQWLGWVAGSAALLGVPAFGGMMIQELIGYLCKLVTYGLAGIVAVWLLLGFALCVFGRGLQALRRATLARVLWPVWVCGMLALAVMIPFYYAQERHWIQKDHLLEISAEVPGLSRYEYDVTRILRAEFLETVRQAGEIH